MDPSGAEGALEGRHPQGSPDGHRPGKNEVPQTHLPVSENEALLCRGKVERMQFTFCVYIALHEWNTIISETKLVTNDTDFSENSTSLQGSLDIGDFRVLSSCLHPAEVFLA